MKKRLRKKKHRGEFTAWALPVRVTATEPMDGGVCEVFDYVLDATDLLLLRHPRMRLGAMFGGPAVVTGIFETTDRAAIEPWLQDVIETFPRWAVEIADTFDAWHGDFKDEVWRAA